MAAKVLKLSKKISKPVAKKISKKKAISLKTFAASGNAAEKAYFKYLNSMLDEFYAEADDLGWTWKDLASESELCYGTIYSIGHRYVRYPRLLTIYKIAKALGHELVVQKIVTLKRRKAS